MQGASMTLAQMPLSSRPDCQVVTSQNGDSFSEVNPVNLVAYGKHVVKSDIDILHCPSDVASYSGYSQNNESPSKFPIDLAVSAPRDRSQLNELLSSNNPVNLASYTRVKPEYNAPSNSSVNKISDASARSSSIAERSLAVLPRDVVQTDSGAIKDQGTSSMLVHSGAYHNTPALIRNLAAASSVLTQQTGGYQRTFGHTPSIPTSCHSAEWRPVLSPRSAQLVSNAVSTSGQQLCADNTIKEGEHNPLLLQFQTAQLQALLRGFPPTSSAQCQLTASPATQRRQFACNICGKMLSSQHNLRLHEATIHRGLFQFHCPICNKGLRQERDLRGHLANRHDWKKEFRCSICGHEFGYKRNLKHHVMSHHGRASLDE